MTADATRLAAELYRVALRIRRAEERIRELYAAGRMPGFIQVRAVLPDRRDGALIQRRRVSAADRARCSKLVSPPSGR